MPVTITLSDAEAQTVISVLLMSAPSGGESPLTTILTEIRAMSETQTQAAADVAQLGTDIQTLKTGLAELKGQISSLQQAAQQAAGTVPADLQAQIDALHALAQTVAPAVAPAPADSSGPTGPQLTPEPQA